jgi:hypothetical protein
MTLKRHEFMLASAAAGLVAAVPRRASAEDGDTDTSDTTDLDRHSLVFKGELIKTEASGEKQITLTQTISYAQPASIGTTEFEASYPQNGTATVVLDAAGTWQFTGSFPAQPKLVQKNLVTVVFILQYESSAKAPAGSDRPPGNHLELLKLAIPAVAIVDANGGTWSRSGNNLLTAAGDTFSGKYYYHRLVSKTHPIKASEALPAMPPSAADCEKLAGHGPKVHGVPSTPICL